jgi:hypothetical protein
MLQIYLDPCTVNSRKVLAGLDLIGTQYNFNHGAFSECLFSLFYVFLGIPGHASPLLGQCEFVLNRDADFEILSSELLYQRT